MYRLVVVLALAAIASADVSHLFRQPTTSLLTPFQSRPRPLPVQQRYNPIPAPVQHYSPSGPQIPILRQDQENNIDSYRYSYETGNGIAVQEQGTPSHNGGEAVSGSFQYTAPDGTPIGVSYIADENGYQPQGAHLPTPPPIPEAILRALAYNEAHPYQEPQQGYQPVQKQPFYG